MTTDPTTRPRKSGQPNRLDTTPGLRDLVAEVYAAGMTRKAMSEHLNCTDKTLKRWLADPEVSVKVEALLRERIIRIRRRVDGELEARIGNKRRLSQMPEETLLKIRKELAADLPVRTDASSAERAVEKLWLIAADNPEAAKILHMLGLDDGEANPVIELEADEVEELPPGPDGFSVAAVREALDDPDAGTEDTGGLTI